MSNYQVTSPSITAANKAVENAMALMTQTQDALDAAAAAVYVVWSEADRLGATPSDLRDLERLAGSYVRVSGGVESLAPRLREYTFALIYAIPPKPTP